MIKFLHTRIRVSNLEASIDWYCKNCGFTLLKRNDKSPAGNQVVHLELPGNAHTLELTYSPDFKVEFPEDLMHTCLGVDDIVEYFETGGALQVGQDSSGSACVLGFQTVPGLLDLVRMVGLVSDSAGDGHRATACELVLEALVAQKRISRNNAGYSRAPHQGPTQGKGYQGFDPMGGMNI